MAARQIENRNQQIKMSNTTKTNIGGKNYNFVSEHNKVTNRSSSSARFQDVTEQVFSGNEPVEYGDLLDSLEETYDLEGLSDYENPDEVRINYHISGVGSSWQNIIQVEVDETQKKLDWIPDYLSPVREKLEEGSIENWSSLRKEYMTTEETHVHTYHDHDISMREMNEFIDNF